MMYVVTEAIDNQEFDFYLEPGEEIYDGEVEPDLIALWWGKGWIEDPNAQVDVAPSNPKKPKKPKKDSDEPNIEFGEPPIEFIEDL